MVNKKRKNFIKSKNLYQYLSQDLQHMTILQEAHSHVLRGVFLSAILSLLTLVIEMDVKGSFNKFQPYLKNFITNLKGI